MEHNNKFVAFHPRNNSRHNTKSRSTKKNQLNKNILTPCEPIGDKIPKALIQKNHPKISTNRKEKTQQSIIMSPVASENTRCYNHPEKKGEYFLQSHPNKKFCLKCSLTLGNGHNHFITKQKHHKKQTLDQFRQQLIKLKHQIQSTRQNLHQSIAFSQINFAQHSSYINESFLALKDLLEEKKRQMINSLIIAQKGVKKVYEENLKKLAKMAKSIERYELDIKKFYDEIIQELPRSEFDHIMQEYENKISKNFKTKLKSILSQDGICVYIPNVELKAIIEKSNVQFYQPVDQKSETKQLKLSFSQIENRNQEQKKSNSNSLDNKINEFVSNTYLQKRTTEFRIPERKRQLDLNLFGKGTGLLLSPDREGSKNRWIQDKENINLENLPNNHDNCNQKKESINRFTFKS